ncbi:glycosyltransferase [Capillimicrobium parvum]|uniref:D-inositol-3-phosphate glycosyltransferase n=1 Tax=Capillimicrobium parvum TaxID=2884022 RepID=A0A9E6Y0L5_9ACTN|nr:glycosyltransferase [Capillimicrobium parvum]UGS37751.1 D-inositol-3-phosphate glycosyltransferase [Capillimicrobium parvum]
MRPRSAADRRRTPILLAVHSARVGGAQLMALDAAGWLADRHELHIAVRRGPLYERFAAAGRPMRASPTMTFGWGSRRRWLLELARSVLDAPRIALYVRRHRIRVVHTNSTVLLGPVIGAWLARVPVVVYARELPPDRRSRLLFSLLGAFADTVVAVSSAVESAFAGARGARVVRISDGIPIPPVPAPREGFGSPLRLCLVGTVNRDGRKGQDVAIDAVARLTERDVDVRLDLVGPIQQETSAAALAQRAAARGVADRVRLAGVSDRVGDVLASSDILLSCAHSEPLGLTIMEALARETPVVATRVGGVPDIVRDGETGILVAPGDPAAVAAGVGELVADPARARAMAARGRIDIAKRFDRTDALRALEAEIARAAAS